MLYLPFLNQIGILFILTLTGLFAYRLNIFTDSIKISIERIVFYISLPLMIFTSLSSMEVSGRIIINGSLVVIFAYISMFLQLGIGSLSAKLLKLPNNQAVIHKNHHYLGNFVFLGFPLLDAIYPGGEIILYAALYHLASNTIMWTLGIMMLTGNHKTKISENLKKLLNPNTISLVLGFVAMLFGFRLPGILHTSFEGLGGITIYLAMLYIGILLGQSSMRGLLKNLQLWVLSFNKLILSPFLMMLIVAGGMLILNLQLNVIAFSAIILEAAMPCMTILVIIARKYGADEKLAMQNFVFTTIASIITLPLVYFILERYFLT